MATKKLSQAIYDSALDASPTSDDYILGIEGDYSPSGSPQTKKFPLSSITNLTDPDATTTSKGKVQLAGDLGGTAASPSVKNVAKVFNVKDYGAVGNGTTDDTAAINSALSAANTAGGGKVYLPASTYLVSGNVLLYSNVILQGAGYDSVLYRANSTNTYVLQNADTTGGNSYIVVSDLKIDANGSNNATAPNVNNLVKVSNSLFLNIWVTNCGNAFRIYNSSNNKFIGNYVNNGVDNHNAFNPQAGSSYNIFTNNVVDGVTVPFNLDGTSGATNYNVISNNTLKNDTVTAGDCIVLANGCNNNAITSNTIYNFHEDGIRITDSSAGNAITGNTISTIGRYGVSLATNNTSNTVMGNTITAAKQGVFIDQTTNKNNVSGNTISASTQTGIYVNSTTYENNISSNVISGSVQYGIYLNGSNYNAVNSNIVNGQGTTSNGIYLLNSSSNVVSGNQVKNCTTNGIRVQATTSSTATIDNIITSNRVYDDQGTKTQGTGINEVSGAFSPDFNTYLGNDVTGNLTTNMNIVGTNGVTAANIGGSGTDPWVDIAGDTMTGNLSFTGTSSKTLAVNRNTTTDTVGQSLILASGGATSGGTNRASGDLLFKTGVSTGTATGRMIWQVAPAGTSGTTDNSASEVMRLTPTGLHIGSAANPTAMLDVGGVINVNSNKITSLATPTVSTDAATKGYVDSVTDGGIYFSVKEYGALGDGSTNDKVAIQAAIDAADLAGGGIVYFPPGTYMIGSTIGGSTAGHYSNITLKGSGRDITTIKATSGIVMVNFGNGDPISGNTWSNLRFEDLSLDGGNFGSNMFNMTLGTCIDVSIENVHFKNLGSGAHAWLFFGVSTNATSAMVARNLTINNCIFSDSAASWEGITLSQALNVKITNTTVRNKANNFALLNYGSHDVSVVNSQFISCAVGLNGFGATEFSNCNFQQASVTNQAWNTTFSGCSWDNINTSGINGLNFVGYTQAAGESFWDAQPAGTNVAIKNAKVINCSFKNANSVAIGARTFTGTDTLAHLSVYDLTIINCSFDSSLWQAIDVKATYLKVQDCVAFNSGQLGTSATAYNYVIAGAKVTFSGNVSYDDQTSHTATSDFFIDNQLSATLIPTMDITMNHNKFTIGSGGGTLPRYYTGSSFTSTQPANITLRGLNNDLINPDLTYAQGNITGATTITRANGRIITATLTGNITLTVPSGTFTNDELILALTQDATGGRTLTLPSNVKVQSTLTLSTAANALDVISFYWDGTNWREKARALTTVSTTPDATASVKGIVQLAGDLGGTASSPTTPTAVHLTGSETITGAKTITAASTTNFVPLTLNQNDTTNNPVGMNINNTGTGKALNITHNGGANNPALGISFTGTTGGGNNVGGIDLASTTTTTGAAINAIWNSASFTGASGYGMMNLRQNNASASGNVLRIDNAGTGQSIRVNTNDLILTSGGLMGIGKTPSTALDVNGTITGTSVATGSLVYTSGANTTTITATTPTGTNSILLPNAGGTVVLNGNTQTLTSKTLTTPTINGVNLGFVAKTGAYTLTATDNTVTGDTTSAAFSLTLPTAIGITGRIYTLKKIDTSANALTVATSLSQTIDGATTYLLTQQNQAITVQSDGANWITLTPKASTASVALTDGATIPVNAALGNTFTVTIAGNRTISNPTNAVDGQQIVIRIKQDATGSRTITWDTNYRFSGGTAPTLTTVAGKTDYVGFKFNSTDTKWDCLAFQGNY